MTPARDGRSRRRPRGAARLSIAPRLVITALKLAVTGALVYWLLANADFGAIGAMLERIGAAAFAGALAAQLGSSLCTAVRWWLLLRYAEVRAGLLQVLPSYYLGVFFNNLLPTGIGGDVVRTVHLQRRGFELRALAASLVMDRAIGLVVMLLLATACATVFEHTGLDREARRAALALLVATLAASAFAFSPWAGALLEWLRRRYRHTRLRHGILEGALLCHAYRAHAPLLAGAAALSLCAQTLAILAYLLLGVGIGLTLAPWSYFVVIPIVFIAAMLPVSIGGLGVREGALVGLLLALGAERQLAIGLSLLYLAVLWLASLPGALVLLGDTGYARALARPSRRRRASRGAGR